MSFISGIYTDSSLCTRELYKKTRKNDLKCGKKKLRKLEKRKKSFIAALDAPSSPDVIIRKKGAIDVTCKNN